MTAKPITSAKDLLDYLLKLQDEYDLTQVEINYYDWHEDDSLVAEYVRLETKYENPILIIE